MRTHAKYRLQVTNDKILTGLDEIRCSNKDKISVTMRWLVYGLVSIQGWDI